MKIISFVLLLFLNACVFIKQEPATPIALRTRFENQFNATLEYQDAINRSSISVYRKYKKRLRIGQIRRLPISSFPIHEVVGQYAKRRFIENAKIKVRFILQDFWLENYKTNKPLEEAFLSVGQEHTVRVVNANIVASLEVEKDGTLLKKQFKESSWWNLLPRTRSKTTSHFTQCADNALNKLILSADDWLSTLNLQ